MTPNPQFGSSQADFRLEWEYELPDEQLIELIVHQVEALFSDENLIRDEFISKHIRKNKGFMNLKLVASLRKVKIIARDWRTVSHAIQVASSKLELNESCNKIRRKQALHPVDSGNKYDRTVFVINLPESKEDIDQLHRDFAIFGRISLIRVIRPSSHLHPSHARLLSRISEQIPSGQEDQPLGVIEFNRIADAQACLEQQHRLIAFDHVWGQVSLCIAKPNIESIANQLSQQTEDPNGNIRQQQPPTTRVHAPPPSPVIRQPFGPDGTRGFHYERPS